MIYATVIAVVLGWALQQYLLPFGEARRFVRVMRAARPAPIRAEVAPTINVSWQYYL